MQTIGNATRNAIRTSMTRLCLRALLLLTLSALTLAGIMSPRSAVAQTFNVEDLGTLSKGTYSKAVAISNGFNAVIGQGDVASQDDHAFYNIGGWNVDLGAPANCTRSYPLAVSGLNIVGNATGILYNGNSQACWWPTAGAPKLLPPLFNVPYSSATGINGSSVIVGWAWFSALQASNAYMYDQKNGYWFLGWGILGGASSSASAINDNGWIVGAAYNAAGHNHAFLWINGAVTDLHQAGFGGDWSDAFALNNAGTVVGRAMTFGSSYHAFQSTWGIFQKRKLVDLKTLPGRSSSEAYSINATGNIVGWSGNPNTADGHAFFYDGTLKDLNSLLDASGAGWTLVSATGINDFGQIVGYGLHNGLQRAFRLRPL